jgi:hypothetical protein
MAVVSARGASRLSGATAGGAGPSWRAAPASRSARCGPEEGAPVLGRPRKGRGSRSGTAWLREEEGGGEKEKKGRKEKKKRKRRKKGEKKRKREIERERNRKMGKEIEKNFRKIIRISREIRGRVFVGFLAFRASV